jgi:hypothetical protein
VINADTVTASRHRSDNLRERANEEPHKNSMYEGLRNLGTMTRLKLLEYKGQQTVSVCSGQDTEFEGPTAQRRCLRYTPQEVASSWRR